MSIEKKVNNLDKEMTQVYDEYVKLHEQFNTHRGKPLQETDLPEVNRLLNEIQSKFAELYPVLHFIATRHQFTNNAVNAYNEFIEIIKKSGAKEDESIKAEPN
jgi:hypothetical protein